MKLYEITNQFVDLLNNEEITEEDANKIGNELAIALREKSTDIVGYYFNEKSDIDAIDTEIKRLQDIKKSKTDKLERFKEYVKINMERLDLKNIDTEYGKIIIAKNPISVEIVDEEKVPDIYKTTEYVIKINKKAIADAYKQGEIIEGVSIHDNNTNLRFK